MRRTGPDRHPARVRRSLADTLDDRIDEDVFALWPKPDARATPGTACHCGDGARRSTAAPDPPLPGLRQDKVARLDLFERPA
ncbi:hypothetical protein ACWKWK_01755 [Pseudoxanthomonas beigongshangi]